MQKLAKEEKKVRKSNVSKNKQNILGPLRWYAVPCGGSNMIVSEGLIKGYFINDIVPFANAVKTCADDW